MLRGTRENRSFLALISNSAGVAVLCFLLLASTIVAVIPQANLHSSTLSSAYAQETDEPETTEEEAETTEEEAETTEEEAETTEEQQNDAQTVNEEPQVSEREALTNVQTLVRLAGITTAQELQQLAAADSPNELARMAGTSNAQELQATPGITDSQAINAIAQVPNLNGLAELIGMRVQEMLRTLLPPPPPPPEEPEQLTAGITSNATQGEAPATFEFGADIAGGTEPYTIDWDFGDGSAGSDEESVEHTYANPGTYTVTLTVTDSDDQEVSDTMQITVEEPTTTPPPPPEEPEQLTAGITSNATQGEAPATFAFGANVSGGTEPYTIDWDFGDGSAGSDEESVEHTYANPGTYTVTLTVTDSDDQEVSDTMQITVEEPTTTPPPTEELTAQIISNATNGTAPATFEFGADIAGGTEPYTIDWDFGDGSAGSDEESVVHTYPAAGTYTVTLTVTDSDDQEVSDTMQITVEEPAEEPPTQGGTDPFGVDEIYPTARNGPTWYIVEQEDPTDDGHFYLSMYRGTTIDYLGRGVWNVDATSGTQEHGIRMHVDSPTGTWKNTEITGYFKANSGSDQFTMIARHGPSYHNNDGCEAYGYYGMTAIDGNVFFKKKLYHFNDGYTKRLAQVEALDNLSDQWVGMKFVVYDMADGNVKLELWIDDGDMTNNWRKVTELVDRGNLAVEGGDDCGRDATDKIDSGTRITYRADNMDFDFKKLSAREIQPPR